MFLPKMVLITLRDNFSRLRSKQKINSYYKSLHIQLLVTSFTTQQLCDENSCRNYFSGIYRRFFFMERGTWDNSRPLAHRTQTERI